MQTRTFISSTAIALLLSSASVCSAARSIQLSNFTGLSDGEVVVTDRGELAVDDRVLIPSVDGPEFELWGELIPADEAADRAAYWRGIAEDGRSLQLEVIGNLALQLGKVAGDGPDDTSLDPDVRREVDEESLIFTGEMLVIDRHDGDELFILVEVPILSCRQDFDESGAVDFADLTTMLAAWGRCHKGIDPRIDLNDDGAVAFEDLTTLLQTWGRCRPTAG